MFWNIIYASITVNFYWSELDILYRQIYCTLDILDIVHSYNRDWIYCILDIVHFLEQYNCANSLNISRQTFCATGYKKDSRTRTFCVAERGTGHRI